MVLDKFFQYFRCALGDENAADTSFGKLLAGLFGRHFPLLYFIRKVSDEV